LFEVLYNLTNIKVRNLRNKLTLIIPTLLLIMLALFKFYYTSLPIYYKEFVKN